MAHVRERSALFCYAVEFPAHQYLPMFDIEIFPRAENREELFNRAVREHGSCRWASILGWMPRTEELVTEEWLEGGAATFMDVAQGFRKSGLFLGDDENLPAVGAVETPAHADPA